MMVIEDICLLEKAWRKSGTFQRGSVDEHV